jgi:hypothetical protein
MKFNKDAPRYRAGHGELKEGTGPITKMCPTAEFLEVYKIDKTFHIRAPENLDPEEKDPNMGWTSSCVANVGSGNHIVARVFIQGCEALQNVSLKGGINKKEIIQLLHQSKELLLSSEKAYLTIKSQCDECLDKLQKGEVEKKGNIYNSFPVVENIELNTATFLMNAKKFIETQAKIINEIFHSSFNGPRFDIIIKWVEQEHADEDKFISFLKAYNEGLERITNLRNAQEHPEKNRKLHVNNVRLLPENKVAEPSWYITREQETAIRPEMEAMIKFLIEFSETLLLFCIMITLETWIPYKVVEIPEDRRDQSCPVRFQIQIDADGLSK